MKTSKEIRILFMGTPEIASASLTYLIEQGYNIVGVVCRPDRRRDRGQKICAPPVKDCGEFHCVPVIQPETLKDEAFAPYLEEYLPELIVVVAYGKILPKYVLDYPKYGCLNLHASILPLYRGAAPIQRSIMNGELETGLSTMYMSEGMDEGDVIHTVKTPIAQDETAGELSARLADLGGPLLAKTIDEVVAGTNPRIPQEHLEATYAPMISKTESRLDFSKSAKEVYNTFRGLTPNPGTNICNRGRLLRITRMSLSEGKTPKGKPGEVVCASKQGLFICCGDGRSISIDRLAPQGRREMSFLDYVNGRCIKKGDVLE